MTAEERLILQASIRKAAKNGWAEFWNADEERLFYAGDMVVVRGLIFLLIRILKCAE
jgi:hypothetical protein